MLHTSSKGVTDNFRGPHSKVIYMVSIVMQLQEILYLSWFSSDTPEKPGNNQTCDIWFKIANIRITHCTLYL
jgi:hypothetical protein